MNLPTDPQKPTDDRPAAEEPLLDQSTVSSRDVAAPVEPVEPTGTPSASAPSPTEQAEERGGGKIKNAALLAGVATVANKVRQRAPKVVQQIREKRAGDRCVILTEADGRSLAIGPYKNEQAARDDIFKVGGAPRVVELVSRAAFFAPQEPAGT